MGFMFFESIVLYAKGVALLGELGPIIAWPLFMLFIIFTSNFWSVKLGEWRNSSRVSRLYIYFSLIFLSVALVLLIVISQCD
jgi:L-rhamnose-H+ transport protein